MLHLARQLNPEAMYGLGEMCTVRIEKTFDGALISDASTCMWSLRNPSRAVETT
jgi:hypothetical protein